MIIVEPSSINECVSENVTKTQKWQHVHFYSVKTCITFTNVQKIYLVRFQKVHILFSDIGVVRSVWPGSRVSVLQTGISRTWGPAALTAALGWCSTRGCGELRGPPQSSCAWRQHRSSKRFRACQSVYLHDKKRTVHSRKRMLKIHDQWLRFCTSHSSQDGLRSTGVPLLTAQTGKDVSRSSSFHELDDLQRSFW